MTYLEATAAAISGLLIGVIFVGVLMFCVL